MMMMKQSESVNMMIMTNIVGFVDIRPLSDQEANNINIAMGHRLKKGCIIPLWLVGRRQEKKLRSDWINWIELNWNTRLWNGNHLICGVDIHPLSVVKKPLNHWEIPPQGRIIKGRSLTLMRISNQSTNQSINQSINAGYWVRGRWETRKGREMVNGETDPAPFPIQQFGTGIQLLNGRKPPIPSCILKYFLFA